MGGLRRRPPRAAVIGVCVGLVVLAAAAIGGRPGRDGPPLDPRSDGPLGTSALVSLLRGLGAEVDLTVGLPDARDDVALVLQDRLQASQRDALAAWVSGGGTLVVLDPSSPMAPPSSRDALPAVSGPLETGACSIEALRDVGEIDGGAALQLEAAPGDESCFSKTATSGFVVARTVELGEVVAVGGAAFVTNDLLGRRDNAVLAATLLAPTLGLRVRVVDPPIPVGGGDKTLGDLVPAGVKRALLQLGVAFVLYALWRAVRLGRPVVEDQPVSVAGSELVSAIGRLLARTRSPGPVADGMRVELRHSLRTRLGVGPDVPVDVLAELAAARSGLPKQLVLDAIDERPVTNDAELVAVARAIARTQQEVPQ